MSHCRCSTAPSRSAAAAASARRSEEHTSELQSRQYLVCRLLLEKKKKNALKDILTQVHSILLNQMHIRCHLCIDLCDLTSTPSLTDSIRCRLRHHYHAAHSSFDT